MSPIAFTGAVELSLPFFPGEKGVCPQLSSLMNGDIAAGGWSPLIESDSRLGKEFKEACMSVQEEAQLYSDFLQMNLDRELSIYH